MSTTTPTASEIADVLANLAAAERPPEPTWPAPILEAATALSLPPSEVASVGHSPEGDLLITTTDRVRYLLVSSQRPDGAGQTGLMLAEATGHSSSIPVFTPRDQQPAGVPEPEADRRPLWQQYDLPGGGLWCRSSPMSDEFAPIASALWAADQLAAGSAEQLATLRAAPSDGAVDAAIESLEQVLLGRQNSLFNSWLESQPAHIDPTDVTYYTQTYLLCARCCEADQSRWAELRDQHPGAAHLPPNFWRRELLLAERDGAAQWLTSHGVDLPTVA